MEKKNERRQCIKKAARWLLMPGLAVILGFAGAGFSGRGGFHGNFSADPDIDHATVLKGLNKTTLEKGEKIYSKSCASCHGVRGIASYPQARSFSKDPLHYGNEPYAMWRTISHGAGLMAPQTWLSPVERYYVVQYIRETFIKKSNPSQYYKITDAYLAGLPKSRRSVLEQLAIARKEALKGSQKYGQEWFRNQRGDYGTAIHSQLKDHTSAALTILLDQRVKLSYNLLRMNTAAVWQGELDLSETKYTRYRGEGQPAIRGKELPGLDCWQWDYGARYDSLQHAIGPRTPLPAAWLDYHGHYESGKGVVLSYAVNGRDVLEYPQAFMVNGQVVLSQTLCISPGDSAQKLFIGQWPEKQMPGKIYAKDIDILRALFRQRFLSAGTASANKRVASAMDERGRIVLTIPACRDSILLQVLRISGKNQKEQGHFYREVGKRLFSAAKIPPIQQMIKGGPARWMTTIQTKGIPDANKAHFDPIFREDSDRLSPAKAVPLPPDYPYTVDNIGLPFDNDYHAWIRPTCLGFREDGRLVIGTYAGDVWMASGIDDSLRHVSWTRIATGLFECMGLKVVHDQIYVTTRNGIVRLHDLNGDGETDFYENFYSDPDVSSFFHAFNFGLETDSKGNFYYTKVGEYTDNKHPGDVMKVSPDGKRGESIASGFRVNNGITVTPDDRIFVSDNQGNWEPANKICLIDQRAASAGGPVSYGYVPNLVSDGWSPEGKKFAAEQLKDGVISPDLVKVPDSFRQPVIWIPQEFDNSPGGGVWSDKGWGPLGDCFINTSYGTGWVYYFLTQQVSDKTQGALVALPFQLDAGIQRAAVNPVDKQVYVVGLTGWDDPDALKYGVLSRIRYKGGQGHLLTGVSVVKDGIKLSFNCRLAKTTLEALSHYEIKEWNYKWSSDYGSDHYSVKEPGKKGEDRLEVTNAVLADDSLSVVLKTPGIGPAQTMRVRFEVQAADGVMVKNSAYLTIHQLPE